ncbi:glutamate racemase [Piscinibacter sakaiensis]|uniref:glutamate racemase n=1 Tax=Piscinibacter sakaiensis TaxID=1547922 RepID=UPI003AAC275F
MFPPNQAVALVKPSTIGIFDSGLGGLSVLRAIRQALPGLATSYLADSAHAPYGERSDNHVRERTLRIAQVLVDDGARLLVVACNTATAAAVGSLRERWPELAIVGVEPGIKPALRESTSGRIGVMATEGTLRSERFQSLMQRELAAAERLLERPIRVHLQPCPGLAAAIETADLQDGGLRSLVDRFCEPLRRAEVDTVVLGCTHYPFVAPLIQAALGPQVRLVDTADAVARQAAVRWVATAQGPACAMAAAAVTYRTSGDPKRLHRAVSEWLGEAEPSIGAFS